MKVLLVTREYPPFEVGGVAKHTYYLAKHLKRLGVLCKVISFGDPKLSDDSVIFVEPSSSMISRSSLGLKSDTRIIFDINRLRKLVEEINRKDRFDIIHVEEPYVGGGIKHDRKVTTIHDTSYGELKSILNHNISTRELKRIGFYLSIGALQEWKSIYSSKIVIVPASHIREELLRVYRAKNESLRIVGNGVEIPSSIDKRSAKQELGFDREQVLILAASQHIPRKRLETLIEAINFLKNKGEKLCFRVAICGDGPSHQALQNMVKQFSLQDIISMQGWVSEEKLHLFYEAADIFVLTSSYEAGPISLLEAAANGASIISSDIETFPRMMKTGIEALLFPVGDFAALATHITKLVTDETFRANLAKNASRFALGFSWEKIAIDTKKIYESLLRN